MVPPTAADPPRIAIRPAADADRPLLYRLAAECLMSGSVLSADDLARLARDILRHTQWQHVAELEAEPAGFLWANLGCPEGLPRIGIAVVAAARGRGVGRALVSHALGLAGAEGYRGLLLAVDASNTGAIALYRRLGFEEAGRIVVSGGQTLLNMHCAVARARQGDDA